MLFYFYHCLNVRVQYPMNSLLFVMVFEEVKHVVVIRRTANSPLLALISYCCSPLLALLQWCDVITKGHTVWVEKFVTLEKSHLMIRVCDNKAEPVSLSLSVCSVSVLVCHTCVC